MHIKLTEAPIQGVNPSGKIAYDSIINNINTKLGDDISEWEANSKKWSENWPTVKAMDRSTDKQYLLKVNGLELKKGLKTSAVPGADARNGGYVVLTNKDAPSVGGSHETSRFFGKIKLDTIDPEELSLTSKSEEATVFPESQIQNLISAFKNTRDLKVSNATFDRVTYRGATAQAAAYTYTNVWLSSFFTGFRGGVDETLVKTLSGARASLDKILGDDFDIDDNVWPFLQRAYKYQQEGKCNFQWNNNNVQRLYNLVYDSNGIEKKDAADPFLGYFMFNSYFLEIKSIDKAEEIWNRYKNASAVNEGIIQIKEFAKEKSEFWLIAQNCIIDSGESAKAIVLDESDKLNAKIATFDPDKLATPDPGNNKIQEENTIVTKLKTIFKSGSGVKDNFYLYLNGKESHMISVSPDTNEKFSGTFQVNAESGDVLDIYMNKEKLNFIRSFNFGKIPQLKVEDDKVMFAAKFEGTLTFKTIKQDEENLINELIFKAGGRIAATPEEDEKPEETKAPETPETEESEKMSEPVEKSTVDQFKQFGLLAEYEPTDGAVEGDMRKGVTVHLGDIVIGGDGKYYPVMKKNIGDGKWDIKAGTKIYRFTKDTVDKINELGFSLKPGDFSGKLMDSLITSAKVFDNK